MKFTTLFGKTVKSIPTELKSASHRLLYKAGYIRQIAAGRYALLPLGYRVWQKIMDIIDEEMIAVGSQRIITPTLHPIDIWKITNRDQAFGKEMYTVKDHHGATFALGATAEGLMVELVKMFNPSYRNLPIYIHQFSGKYRDEKRPKGGLIRVREFVMKDAYSFDKSEKDLNGTYDKFFNAYLAIAKRMDLKVVPVLAESGAIGGEYNHEFIVESKEGEGEALKERSR
jgi:prolyl-tRNA synthetase